MYICFLTISNLHIIYIYCHLLFKHAILIKWFLSSNNISVLLGEIFHASIFSGRFLAKKKCVLAMCQGHLSMQVYILSLGLGKGTFCKVQFRLLHFNICL